MSATPQDVQAKLDAAVGYLNKTTSSGAAFVTQYGSDWTKWPATSNWYQAYKNIAAARTEAGQLLANITLKASFTSKEG